MLKKYGRSVSLLTRMSFSSSLSISKFRVSVRLSGLGSPRPPLIFSRGWYSSGPILKVSAG